MRRLFAGALVTVCAISLALPLGASAAALTDAQISAIISLVQSFGADASVVLNVEASLRGSTPPGVGVVKPTMPPAYGKRAICMRLLEGGAVNAAPGVQSDSVKELQEFLTDEGTFTATATGYFGSVTTRSLGDWQIKNGVVLSADPTAGWGTFGPRTKDSMRVRCGGSPSAPPFSATPLKGQPPLTVTFSTWLSGFHPSSLYFTIDYGDGTTERAADCNAPADACISPGLNKHTYQTAGMYLATLNKITDPCPDDGDPSTPRCLAAIQQEVIGKLQIYVGTDVITNKPPVISGISGPTTLAVGGSGTWTVKASDPENGSLSYQISWGDMPMAGSAAMQPYVGDSFTQTSTFSHTYSMAGTYTIVVVVKDSAGNMSKTSTTVKVGQGWSEVCPMNTTWACAPVTQGVAPEVGGSGVVCGCSPISCSSNQHVHVSRATGTWTDGSLKGTFSCTTEYPPSSY